ncbi:MAG: WD40 repeat domain-containing protein [Promethearchaeia archaeon]
MGELESKFIGHRNSISSLALTSDGKKLISGSFDKVIKIWSFEDGKLLGTIKAHSNFITSIILILNDKHIIRVSYDNQVNMGFRNK